MKKEWIYSCILSAGLCILGICIYCGFKSVADKDRIVTVKGLSTRDVRADYVVWAIDFDVRGNDLVATYAERNREMEAIKQFLKAKGFEDTDFRESTTRVSDNWAKYYVNRQQYQYSIGSKLVVATNKVDLVEQQKNTLTELLNQGIMVNSNDWSTDFQFNGLNELKPIMIEEATKNARAVAQKFADDAECDLGTIRHASQGQFSVESDEYTPIIKHVRVVTTISYSLD